MSSSSQQERRVSSPKPLLPRSPTSPSVESHSIQEEPQHRIEVACENPFIIKISSCDGRPLFSHQQKEASRRKISSPNPAPNDDTTLPGSRRKRKVREIDYTYSGGFSDDDADAILPQPTASITTSPTTCSPITTKDDPPQEVNPNIAPLSLSQVDPNAIDSPPPGQLTSLWYSQEHFLHIFVIEKILGWKTRPKPTVPSLPSDLDLETALKTSEKLLTLVGTDQRKRREISRINAMTCPAVLAELDSDGAPHHNQHHHPREEVLLIKWRGRSYRHCSWERAADLIRFDPSNNTAKGKIKRYMVSQELVLGRDWKKLLEEGRRGGPVRDINDSDDDSDKNIEEDEEFFPPNYLEVDRILACDESEMDMKVLAKQRALNLRAQREALLDQEENSTDRPRKLSSPAGAHRVKAVDDGNKNGSTEEEPWDPEDNVRYVVKWKGLQASELTWEYWRDIKHDFVESAEDFWWRQRVPKEADVVGKPHPHVRDFKKLLKSPSFGISEKQRPVFDLGDGFDYGVDNSGEGDGDDLALRLRGYQLEGVNWLLWNWWNRRSCILADEMGLGKTIQTVCFLDRLSTLKETRVRGPFLVVAPLSLISQWQAETTAWAPDMNCILYHGSADARAYLVEKEFYYREPFVNKTAALKLRRQHVTKFHMLITTYEVAMKDVGLLAKIRWRAMIVDEAHRLKNAKSRLFSELRSVPREFCLLLTGTPLQNSTDELWALLNFTDPVTFSSNEAFVQKFGQLTDATQVSDLHAVLKPYLLRRVKEDVTKFLPPKSETLLEVTLTPIQKKFYKAIYERNTAFLFKGAKPSNAPSLMNVMMELRKCCNHPFLIRGAEERILADAASAASSTVGNSIPANGEAPSDAPASKVDMSKLVADHLVKSSGKMVLIEKLLAKLFSGGHKVLIFSQMVRVLDLLAELLRIKQYKFERLDGSTSASARVAAVDRFHRKACQRFVMLLSTRAGGLGLNLTAADTVIIFDSDWNPQNDLQAMARAHRIGQTRAVRVYRLLTAKTYEMHMFHSASMKLGLDRAVLAHQRQNEADEAGDASSATGKSKSKTEREKQAREIDELLKKGAYDVFKDDDDNEAQRFMETDIDQLLERSSRTVTYGDNAASTISSGLGSFSKASFVASTGDAEGKDVDLDDPDFWEKAVGLEAPPESATSTDAGTALLLEGYSDKKRNRKQVQVFDPYASFAEAEKKKKDKLAQKMKQEKEEKAKARLEKKRKKIEEKEKKRRERDETKVTKGKSGASKDAHGKIQLEWDVLSVKERRLIREGKAKKLKNAERRRALRRAEMEDPVFERMRQAWDCSQRDKVTRAALNFGFGRFCKVRHESNLMNLPIQDVEVFLRAYFFQVGLQASVSLLSRFCVVRDRCEEMEEVVDGRVVGRCTSDSAVLNSILSPITKSADGKWIADAIFAAVRTQAEIISGTRFLRVPSTLADPTFVSKLRNVAAMLALKRLAFLSRLNQVVETALDHVLQDLGAEELGKRGCPTKKLSELDVDMKAKLVTTEELSHAIGQNCAATEQMGLRLLPYPSPWWDRSCDVGLVIGTFIHGLGNYDAMGRDDQLPFSPKIEVYARSDPQCAHAMQDFCSFVDAVKSVFSLEIKGEPSVRSDPDGGSRCLKEGSTTGFHSENDAHSPLPSRPEQCDGDHEMPSFDPSATECPPSPSEVHSGEGCDVVTLLRLADAVKSVQCKSLAEVCGDEPPTNGGDLDVTRVSSFSVSEDKRHAPGSIALPMPDSRILDRLLVSILEELDGSFMSCSGEQPPFDFGFWAEDATLDLGTRESGRKYADDISTFVQIMSSGPLWEDLSCQLLQEDTNANSILRLDDRGVDSCCVLGNESSYTHEAAIDLNACSEGDDTFRRKKGKTIPSILTRYGITALIFSDRDTISLADSSGLNCHLERKDVPSSPPPSSPLQTSNNIPLLDRSRKEEHSNEMTWREDAHFRAMMCITLLNMGSPVSKFDKYQTVDTMLLGELATTVATPKHEVANLSEEKVLKFFTIKDMCTMAGVANKVVDDGDYIRSVLLPHCLQTCLFFADAKVSRRFTNESICRNYKEEGLLLDKKEKSKYVEFPFDRLYLSNLSPLPDPLIPLHLHADSAAAHALAVLRRARLMRALRYVVGGGIAAHQVIKFLKGPSMRKNMDGVPIWWCPWIHDLALLIIAATQGLFRVVVNRSRLNCYDPTEKQCVFSVAEHCFSIDVLESHIRAVFVDGQGHGNKPVLPQCYLESSSSKDLDSWVKTQASQFPTALVIERRISAICGHLTGPPHLSDAKLTDDVRESVTYAHLPMFDHGSWPSMGGCGVGTGLSCGNRAGNLLNKSLLAVAEDEL